MPPITTIQPLAAKRRGKGWPRIYLRRYRSGVVGYVVDLGKQPDGKRARRIFATKAEAQTFAEQKRIERTNEGTQGLTLPCEIRREAATCLTTLAPYGASLTEATEYFVEHVLRYRTGPPVAGIIAQLLDETEHVGCRPATLKSLAGFLRRFGERFGQRQLPTLTLEELNGVCLVPKLAPRTRFNRIRMVSQLYNFAVKRQWVKENLAQRIAVPLQVDRVPEFLEVAEVQRLLAHAAGFDLLAYVAIGLFAGVRRAELQRLSWAAVNLADREIVIGPEIAKTRSRRVIPFDDTLAAWLKLCARSTGPIVDSTTFETRFVGLRRAAELEHWPHNALRHSFATYHVAHFRDPVRTGYLLGHRGGTDMLDAHYRGLVSSAKAKELWNLRPPPLTVAQAFAEAA